jgi:uncharacterized membrane protein YbhN (UPF0104 family)
MITAQSHRPKRSNILIIGLIIIAIYILLPQVGSFQNSLIVLKNINLLPIGAALLTISATFFLAALTYRFLTLKPLQYHRTVLVALANMFTNRLLPAGTGSIATFYLYLRRNKHTVTQAGSVIAVNNSLGFAAHISLLGVTFVLYRQGFSGFQLPYIDFRLICLILAVMLSLILFLTLKKSWHRRLRANWRQLIKNIKYYFHYPTRLLGAYSSSLTLTLCHAATLWFCTLAVGLEIGFLTALAIFSIGILAGTATPTPGGLGGTEAGLLAGLIAYQVPAESALAAVIVYRLIGYWLTLFIGIITYGYISKRNYLVASN